MNHDAKKSTTSVFGRVLVSVAVAAAGLLAGCSNEPPGCAAPEATQTLREVIASQVQQLLQKKDDVVARYFKTHKLGIEMITSDGYDANAKRYACQATVTVSATKVSARVRYAIQTIEGEHGRYLVKTFGDSSQFVYEVLTNVERFAIEDGERVKLKAEADRIAEEAAHAAQESAAAAAVAVSASASASASVPANRDEVTAAPPMPLSSAPVVATTPTVSSPGPLPPVVATASPAAAPSFNCTAKLSSTEQLICDTPALSKADAALALAYAKAVSAATDPAVLKQRQRDWRKARDICPDADCVQASYIKRTEELSR